MSAKVTLQNSLLTWGRRGHTIIILHTISYIRNNIINLPYIRNNITKIPYIRNNIITMSDTLHYPNIVCNIIRANSQFPRVTCKRKFFSDDYILVAPRKEDSGLISGENGEKAVLFPGPYGRAKQNMKEISAFSFIPIGHTFILYTHMHVHCM